MSTPIDPDILNKSGSGCAPGIFWPIILIMVDCYDPKSAQAVMDCISHCDDLTLSAMWACHGFAAMQDAEGRQN